MDPAIQKRNEEILLKMKYERIKSTAFEHGYEIIQPIGKGGFGTCFIVLNQKCQLKFVMKVIKRGCINEGWQ